MASADRAEIARFLGVSLSRIPLDPESLDDPKHVLVQAAARSSKRAIREGLVPEATSGRAVGRLYTPMLRGFVEAAWRPDVAACNADSLLRCVAALSKVQTPGRTG